MAAELIAWKTEDYEFVGVEGGDVLVESFEALVLWCEAAFGGGVDYEDDFALELVEGEWVSGGCRDGISAIALRRIREEGMVYNETYRPSARSHKSPWHVQMTF